MHQHHHTLENQFADRVKLSGLIMPGNTIVLAVSGGIDSMVMLHLFGAVRADWNLHLAVAHINHQLRGEESDGDEAFVRRAALSLEIPCFNKRVDTLGHAAETHLSKQEAARNLRYEFFEEIRRQRNADCVATAHQADDNAETVLMNALRGAGVRGLSGIPERRDPGKIIRPLLFARRRDIEQYANDRKIEFRADSSNESTKYRRNYVRQTVIPMLEASTESDVIASLNKLSQLMHQLDAMISAEVKASMDDSAFIMDGGEGSIAISALQSKPPYLQEGMILELFRKIGAEVESDKVHRVLGLCDLETGSVVQLSKTLHVYRDRDRLAFVRPGETPIMHQAVSLGDSYSVGDFRFSLSAPVSRPASFGSDHRVEFVDAGKLGDHLVLRSWRDGDWFIPLGMKTKKKVSDFFIDEKIPLVQKRAIPILESDGSVVWICGRRLDDRFKITHKTKSVVRLEFNPTSLHH
ncbi:MAG: tRNA lysidine(34) synthetase TilS [Ignavibacteriales bacterium]|nr:tRNA lysidine(34) synthetase TilS [Ignavibacteriales bacterium]